MASPDYTDAQTMAGLFLGKNMGVKEIGIKWEVGCGSPTVSSSQESSHKEPE